MKNTEKLIAEIRAGIGRPVQLEEATAMHGRQNILEYLERNVWPNIPQSELARVLTREQEDELLGYGPDGV